VYRAFTLAGGADTRSFALLASFPRKRVEYTLFDTYVPGALASITYTVILFQERGGPHAVAIWTFHCLTTLVLTSVSN